MKAACLALFAVVLAVPALAAEPAPTTTDPGRRVCIDPKYSYQARYLNGNEVIAKMTFGRDHREVKLTTTCVGLQKEDHLSLSSDFSCIAKGDTLVASKIDGHRQSCHITNVEPFMSTAPEPRG